MTVTSTGDNRESVRVCGLHSSDTSPQKHIFGHRFLNLTYFLLQNITFLRMVSTIFVPAMEVNEV